MAGTEHSKQTRESLGADKRECLMSCLGHVIIELRLVGNWQLTTGKKLFTETQLIFQENFLSRAFAGLVDWSIFPFHFFAVFF